MSRVLNMPVLHRDWHKTTHHTRVTRVKNIARLERVQCKWILKIHGILNILSPEYAKVSNLSGT